MRIVIAGAGAVGRSIARELLGHGHKVTLIDINPKKMEIASVPDADWLLADCCSIDDLNSSDIENAEVVVSATGDDKVNLVCSLLAKTEFGVPKTVARVNNPKNEWMFDENWGVDVAVSTPRVMTSLVEEVVAVGIPVHLFSFHTSGADMYSLTIPEDSAWIGQAYTDLELPHSTVLAAILRDTYPLSLSADLTIEAGDELLLLFTSKSLQDVEAVKHIFAVKHELITDIAQDD